MCEEMNGAPAGEERELTPEEKEQALKERIWAVVAQQVRESGRKEQYVTLSEISAQLELEREPMRAVMEEMQAQEPYRDICVYEGAKDLYYYTYPLLAHNYVRTLAMAQEDDLASIIAQTVRYESKTYPRATLIDTFSQAPYHYTGIQVRRMLERMQKDEQYKDLETYESKGKNFYIFSTKYLTRFYITRVIEMLEDKRQWL